MVVGAQQAGLATDTFGGEASLGAQGQRQIRRERRTRRLRGNAAFTNFDALLGLNRQLSGNNRINSLAAAAGQGELSLDDRAQQSLSQFFNPQVSGQQQQQIEALAKRAGSQGLAGGAVRGQLGDLATRFVAGNRAQAFGDVQNIINTRVGDIQQQVNPFISQIGALSGAGAQQALGASGGTTGDFLGFARSGLQALSAVGLGADALAGIAGRQGVEFGSEGLTGAGDISQAFQQFLNPGTQAFGQFLSQENPNLLPIGKTRGRFFGRNAEVASRNAARGLNRIGAGQQLAGRVGQISQNLSQEALAFSAEGFAGISQLNAGGSSVGAASRLANADFSQFQGLTGALGFGTRTQAGRAGATSGTQFLAGNALFSQVFG